MTTGAGNDLERATELARKMVCEWGMSDAMGPLTFGKKEEQIFLGREIAQHQDYSEDTALKIDHEVKRFVTEQLRARARRCSRSTRTRCSRSPTRCWRARCSTPSRSAGSSPANRSNRSSLPPAPAAAGRRRLAQTGEGSAGDRAVDSAAAGHAGVRTGFAVRVRGRVHGSRFGFTVRGRGSANGTGTLNPSPEPDLNPAPNR